MKIKKLSVNESNEIKLEKSTKIEEKVDTKTVKPIFAKWNKNKKCIIVSKEEYEGWDD